LARESRSSNRGRSNIPDEDRVSYGGKEKPEGGRKRGFFNARLFIGFLEVAEETPERRNA